MTTSRVQELVTLKTIAETLNRATELEPMLQDVLARLLEVTGLDAGWIFLVDEAPHYSCVADCNLPPALLRDDKRPMREGVCWCLGSYWDGGLRRAVNIMSCKRLEDAVTGHWGDTRGITHHATVPLMAGDQCFGLLNVAAPGKQRFSREELALLEAVACQIGTAIERVRLFQRQQRRADNFARLHELSWSLGSVLSPHRLPGEAVRQVAHAFDWPVVAIFVCEGAEIALRAVAQKGRVRRLWRTIPRRRAGAVALALDQRRTVVVRDVDREPDLRPRRGQPAYRSAVVVPLRFGGQVLGALLIGSDRPRAFSDADVEVAEAVADHIALAVQNARLHQQRRDLARVEERHRLARDLHDSISQALFSISLTARGAEDVVRERPDTAAAALAQIRELAQAAQREMRALIWQLRPAGLEEGLVTALQRYGEGLGLQVDAAVEGVRDLPRAVEEALWRIGQESLNNVSRHAGTPRVRLRLLLTDAGATLEVADEGRSFDPRRIRRGALGLAGMRERARALGGTLTLETRRGKGTTIRAWIPCAVEKRGEVRGDSHLAGR